MIRAFRASKPLVVAVAATIGVGGTPTLAQNKRAQPPFASPLDVENVLRRDAAPKEGAFNFPEFDEALRPWFEFKERLLEEHGFAFGMDYQAVALGSNNSVGEDSAFGGVARILGNWDLIGGGTPTTGSLVFNLQHRHAINSDVPPEGLGLNFGYQGLTASSFSDQGLGIDELFWKHTKRDGAYPYEIRFGMLDAFSYFNVSPASDVNTAFMNNSMIVSPTVAYPAPGALGVAGFLGFPGNFYGIASISDANAVFGEVGLHTLEEGDFFKALEIGWSDRAVSSDLFRIDNINLGLWHRDAVDKPDSEDAWGATVAGFWWNDGDRFGYSGRAGWASDGAGTLNEISASAQVFGNFYKQDLVGFGIGWGEAFDSDEDQITTEVFYRWQLAKNLAITPSAQFLLNPASNPDDDAVAVLGLRTRFTF